MIAKNDFITSEKTALEGDLHDLLAQKEELDLKIEKLEVEAERCRNEMNTYTHTMLHELLRKCFIHLRVRNYLRSSIWNYELLFQ